MAHTRLVLAAAAVLTAVVASAIPQGLQARLEEVARLEAKKYNCSISIAFRNEEGQALVAVGTVDFESGRQASVSDKYPFGSVTKLVTGASIMKLVSQGVIKLDEKIAPLVDPFIAKMAARDPKQNFTCLKDLWGEGVENMTLRKLLAMQSGIPDFDTATPNLHGLSTDPLRVKLYSAPDHRYTPPELMSVPWVAGKWKECKKATLPVPGFRPQKFCYSSTNFLLLGMVLAAHGGGSSWLDLDQSAFLPPSLRGQITFANQGKPRDYTAVHGYDRTSYNLPKGEHAHHDTWEVDGVFAGWTASNMVATPAAIAELAWQIYGPHAGVVPKEYVQQMLPLPWHAYGLATLNMGFESGHSPPLGVGYGHAGGTYGYQSVVSFFPSFNVSLAVATNLETDNQIQPEETLCFSFNAIAGLYLNKTFNCQFVSYSFFGGSCKCDPQVAELVV